MEASEATPTGGWTDRDQVSWYTERIGKLEARLAGEAALRDALSTTPRRILDLGCGDGRLGATVLEAFPSVARMVAADRSEPMLRLARQRFRDDDRVQVVELDLNDPLRLNETFDVVVSGFAIHHLDDRRKRSLFSEIGQVLNPEAVFANLEVVQSSTPRRHAEFLNAIGRTADDPEDRLATIEDQLDWMRAAQLTEVDCLWRWRGFALLIGEAPLP